MQIIAAQIIQAIFVAITMGNGLSYFAEQFPHSPGVAPSKYTNAMTIGRVVGILGGGYFAQFLGFRYVNLVCLSILNVACFIL